MNSKGASRFVSDAGTEVSVRTSRDIATDAVLIEPLYATDIELLDGASGALHAEGEPVRGTLRRNGGAFVLTSEPLGRPRPRRAARKKSETAPPAAPVVPRVATATAVPVAVPAAQKSTAPDGEELAAIDTVSRFVRGERGVALKAARRAHTVIGRFILERERQARAPASD